MTMGEPSRWRSSIMGDDSSFLLSSFHNFTGDIHVLVADNDKNSRASLVKVLHTFSYKVTEVESSLEALRLIPQADVKIDIMISDIRLAAENGAMLLHEAAFTYALPTVITSAYDDAMVAKSYLENGAWFFLKKPAPVHALKNLWQFVVRDRLLKLQTQRSGAPAGGTRLVELPVNNPTETYETDANGQKKRDPTSNKRMRSDHHRRNAGEEEEEEEKQEEEEEEKEGDSDKRKATWTEWTDELHHKFMAAVNQLGEGRCFPKHIVKLMNVPGLTRVQIASHLQKCRRESWRYPENRRQFFNGSPFWRTPGTMPPPRRTAPGSHLHGSHNETPETGWPLLNIPASENKQQLVCVAGDQLGGHVNTALGDRNGDGDPGNPLKIASDIQNSSAEVGESSGGGGGGKSSDVINLEPDDFLVDYFQEINQAPDKSK